MMPHWYQLVTENGTRMGSITKVKLDTTADVDDFRDAVKTKNADGLLKGISPAELTVYLNKDAFKNRETVAHMKASAPVTGGESEENALIVVVPNKTQGMKYINGRREYGHTKSNT
jgi:hypothetical protein